MSSTIQKLWSLLELRQRRAAGSLLALTLVGTLLETIGIGAVVPAIGLLASPDFRTRGRIGAWIGAAGWSDTQLVVFCMGGLVAIYAVKMAYLTFVGWRQARFAFAVQTNISERLFIGYLRQPWTFHLQRNSADLLRNVTTEVSNLNNVVQSVQALGTEALVLIGVTILMLVVEPIGAGVVIVVLGGASWSFHRITRARLLQWGTTRQAHEGMRVQHVQQGFGAVKDVKVLGREAEFLEQFRRHNEGNARVGERQVTLQQIPRLWLELLAVVGLAALVLIMVAHGTRVDMLLPVLGLFAAAAFRLMPSVVRIMNAFQVIRYYVPVVDTLHRELTTLPVADDPAAARSMSFHRAVALDGVTFRYPTAHVAAIEDINVSIERGSSVGVIGESGAGKSTLIDVVLGLLTPERGRVLVDGCDIHDNVRGWQAQIGYVPQTIYLTDDTLRRNVAFGLADGEIDDAAVRRALTAARLDEFVDMLPNGVETRVGERGVQLSGGQRQRVGIARALYHDPAVLVLDEATSSLDTATEHSVMDAVGALRGDKTLVIVTHRLSTVSRCDRLYRLEQGRVVAEGAFEHVTRN